MIYFKSYLTVYNDQLPWQTFAGVLSFLSCYNRIITDTFCDSFFVHFRPTDRNTLCILRQYVDHFDETCYLNLGEICYIGKIFGNLRMIQLGKEKNNSWGKQQLSYHFVNCYLKVPLHHQYLCQRRSKLSSGYFQVLNYVVTFHKIFVSEKYIYV